MNIQHALSERIIECVLAYILQKQNLTQAQAQTL